MGQVLRELDLINRVKEIKALGKLIGLTNGCFDILHIGHIESLKLAKNQCECLIVLVNSDLSVQELKGKNRPIINETDRCELLASLIYVDYVGLFNETTPKRLISLIKPDIYFKGSDYDLTKLPESKIVETYGGKIVSLNFLPNNSTSNIINKIKSLS